MANLPNPPQPHPSKPADSRSTTSENVGISETVDTDLIVYQQRYNTWRYLDRLRWQFVRFLVAGVTAIATISGYIPAENFSWMYIAGGFFLIMMSLTMLKVNSAIRANGLVLKKFGARVGDTYLPDASKEDQSINHWIAVVVIVLGALSVGYGMLSFTDGLQ